MIIPRYPSELNKKPPLEKLERVNNNYNKLKKQFADRPFQFISKTFGVVGKHTSKLSSRGAATHPQLINGKDIT